MLSTRNRPSPAVALAGAALVIALAALVLSLTGIATGLPGKNRIDRNDLGKNVVGFKSMRNNAIGGAEVRPNALGGADINESSLGQVPSAGSAQNADQLDGLDASSLVRVASDSDSSITNGTEDWLSTSITAPVNGYLMIVASIDAFSLTPPASDSWDCLVELDGNQVALRTAIVDSDGNSEENCTLNAVAQVSAGAHTVDFDGNSVSATDVGFQAADLSVLFVPFGPSGN